jgi:hypothetical protein
MIINNIKLNYIKDYKYSLIFLWYNLFLLKSV